MKTDKTSTILIMNKTDYIKEGERQLNNIHYQETEYPDLSSLKNQLMTIIKTLKNEKQIDQKTYEFLKQTENVQDIGTMYLLPKIHKFTPEQLFKFTQEGMGNTLIPGRPIIAQCNTLATYIGKFIDHFLLEYVQSQNTYVLDTPDFIRKIENTPIPNDAILVVYDVTSMYTNMEIHKLVNAVDQTLPNLIHKDPLPPIKKKYIIQLLKIAVENNYFQFNGKTYLQVIGASMGFIASPQICDIRMFQITSKMMESFPYPDSILFHGRFRDDGFLIFKNHPQAIDAFFEIANNQHHLLKFTWQMSDFEVTFLDTTVFKGQRFMTQNILDIKTYRKPTEKFLYLERSSHHPEATFKALLKGEIIRIIRTNNNEDTRKEQFQLFKSKLMERNYKELEIDAIFQANCDKPRENLLLKQHHEPRDHNSPIFISTYDKRIKNLNKILSKHWNTFSESSEHKRILPYPPMVAFRKNKNIKDLIINAKLK